MVLTKAFSDRIEHAEERQGEDFPRHVAVRKDKPGGKVCYDNGLVDFVDTNVVIQAWETYKMSPLHDGPLSLRFAFGGQQTYEVEGRHLVVDDGTYVILNCGQTLRSSSHSATPVESFAIGFWPGFAEGILACLVTPQDHLLDDPSTTCQSVQFFDQIYPHDAFVSPILQRLRAAMDWPDMTEGWLEEQHYELLQAMLCAHRNIGKEIESMPALRLATRVELYQRLHRARDFMEASLEQPLTIPQIAREAWASPYHFLRQFKEVFGETPHQYLTRRRLERARQLLQNTDRPVTEICLAVGFDRLGSFSRLFKQHLGVSPQTFRLEQRRK